MSLAAELASAGAAPSPTPWRSGSAWRDVVVPWALLPLLLGATIVALPLLWTFFRARRLLGR